MGHYLTVINVQLEKALAFRDKKPMEADQAVSNAKRLASEALGDVRRSVGTLRATQEIPSLFPAITELVKHMQNNQYSVELTIEGSEEGFSKQGLMALYRAVQEGLTNVEKHANAHHVLVKLHFGEQGAYLSLSDDGSGFESALLENQQAGQEGGYGLQGLRERLELVGGRLQLESRPGEGTCLCVTIPKDPLVRNELLLVQAQKE